MRQGIRRDQLTIHQDNGAPMTCGPHRPPAGAGRRRVLQPARALSNPYIRGVLPDRQVPPRLPRPSVRFARSCWCPSSSDTSLVQRHHRHSNIRFVTRRGPRRKGCRDPRPPGPRVLRWPAHTTGGDRGDQELVTSRDGHPEPGEPCAPGEGGRPATAR